MKLRLRVWLPAIFSLVLFSATARAQAVLDPAATDLAPAAASVTAVETEGVIEPKGLFAPKPSFEAEAVAPAAFAAPVVYVCDNAGRLATINLDTKVVKVIGVMKLKGTSQTVVLTDIGFSPAGVLYGVSFTQFYRVDPVTAKVTKIGTGLGAGGINALTFSKPIPGRGTQAVAASFSTNLFYQINTTTGRATNIGNNGGFRSAGDFAFDGVHLYFAASGKKLVDYTLSTTAVTYVARPVTLTNLFGLVVPQHGTLVGFAGTKAYRLNTATGASTLLFDFTGKGLGTINGAASKSLF